jgi:hypothetical protein
MAAQNRNGPKQTNFNFEPVKYADELQGEES